MPFWWHFKWFLRRWVFAVLAGVAVAGLLLGGLGELENLSLAVIGPVWGDAARRRRVPGAGGPARAQTLEQVVVKAVSREGFGWEIEQIASWGLQTRVSSLTYVTGLAEPAKASPWP